jgi:hypothetical protein
VTQTLGDGTKIEQRTTAKIYRDSTGRIRRDQTVIGLDRLNPVATPQTTITFDTVPGDPMPYTLNPATKTARRGARRVQWSLGLTFQGGRGGAGNTATASRRKAPRVARAACVAGNECGCEGPPRGLSCREHPPAPSTRRR